MAELKSRVTHVDVVIPSAFVIAFHKLAKSGYADAIRLQGRMMEFEISDQERQRWPQLADADKLWLVYEEK